MKLGIFVGRATALICTAALFRAIVLMSLVLVSSARLAAQPNDNGSAVVDRWAAAFSTSDAAAVTSLYAPDATLLSTSNPTLLQGSESVRSYYSRFSNSGSAVKLGDRRVVAVDPSTTLVTGFYDFTLRVNGQTILLPA